MADMGTFWDERAREDAFFFVDDRLEHGAPDVERFWVGGEESVQTMLDALGAEITPGAVVLDLGCGLGRLSRALVARGAGRVIALDASQEMLDRAQAHNAQLGDAVEWVHGDGTSLSGVEDASIDVVFSLVVFQHIPDPAITLGYVAEIGRVLRPGGWAGFQVSTDPSIHEPRRPPRRLRLRARSDRAPKGQDDPRWLGTAIDLDALRATAVDAGLELDRVVGAGTQFTLVRATRGA